MQVEMSKKNGIPPGGIPEVGDAAFTEHIVGESLKIIKARSNAEDALRRLLKYLGGELRCSRVYVFEVIDRLHLRNTYEWCAEGVESGIDVLPYLAKKDLIPWYESLEAGEPIIITDVGMIKSEYPVIYDILRQQRIDSLVLNPMIAQGVLVGFLGVDDPPASEMDRISVLLDVLAHFVCSLVSQRELRKLREKELAHKGAVKVAPLGKTVLLIDDSPELLAINKRVLRSLGYDIVCAASAAEANEKLEEKHPDLIISDVDLPDGNGIDLCLDARERGIHTPVIFLSARSDIEALESAAEGYAFLSKPYQIEELQAAVSNALDN